MFFKTIDDLKLYIKINGTVDIRSLDPFGNDAQEKYIRPYLGNTLYSELTAFLDSGTPPSWEDIEPAEITARLNGLSKQVKNALAKFIFVLGAPAMDLQVTDAGFVVMMNQNLAPASSDRVKRFTDGLERLGYDAIESLLRFLESDIEKYPSWKDSPAYAFQFRNFINSAEEFDKYVGINASRLTFLRWRNTIDNVEILQVDPAISPELAGEIRLQIRTKEVSEKNAKLLPFLCRAVANYTAATELKDERYERLGAHFLAEARKILDAAPDDYPLYKNSSAYSSSRTTYSNYENSDGTGIFVFGG